MNEPISIIETAAAIRLGRLPMVNLSRLDAAMRRKYEVNRIWRGHRQNPVMPLGSEGAGDSVVAAWASVVHVGKVWRMSCSRMNEAGRFPVCLVASFDRIYWEISGNGPALEPAPLGGWESLLV